MKYYKILITTLLTSLSLNCFAASDKLPGNYVCEGYDPFAKANFKMGLTVRKVNQTYTFESTEQEKPNAFKRTVVFNKDKPNVLAVVSTAQNSQQYYITLYEMNEKGDLLGNWTLFGSDQIVSEYCKRQ